VRRLLLCAVTVLALAGCSAQPPPPAPGPDPSLNPQPGDRDRLAAIAATAKDRRYIATYLWTSPNRPDRTVTVALGTDGSWVVAVPAGALSGLADIAIYRSETTLHQCLLGPAAGTAGVRPDLGPLTPSCVIVDALDTSDDPRVQHIFTDWIDRLIDRSTALSIAAEPLAGVQGSCFSIESTAAALAPPVDPGVYCYREDGTLTYARTGFGTLLLAGAVQPAPPSVALPAPVVDRAPLPVTAPAP